MRLRVLALLAAAAVGTASCGPADSAGRTGRVGEVAPAYAAPTLAGDSISLASLRGDVVLLNVWATWCPPCREEIPQLQALHERHAADGLRVIGVSVDNAAAHELIDEFVEDFGIGYSILHDPGERVSTVFRVPGVPATFLIDRAGVVRWRHLGPFTLQDATLRRALDAAL
ncbi:MAG: peroxiredoxin family protein [Longimicrobiales bacterium]